MSTPRAARGGATMAPRAAVALALASLAVLGGCGALAAATEGDHDIPALLSAARQAFDLERLDAVVLLEEAEIEIAAAGGRRTTVHRLVWIGTELGSDTYADLRVPYNTAREQLEVHVLRTWREGRWWPAAEGVSPTAVVETLPGELETAADYADIRETMLLHDGVEIPCVVETRYTITEREPESGAATPRGPSRHGADGLWIFAQADPVGHSILRLTVPAGTEIRHASLNGAPPPDARGAAAGAAGAGGAGATRTLVWNMERVARIPPAHPAEAAEYLPAVIWSTWGSWEDLGSAAQGVLTTPTLGGGALRDSLQAALRHKPALRARAQEVASFVERWTRRVSYDPRFWVDAPRSAERTWETAYGHDLDRTLLAAALFREAGLESRVLWRGRLRREIAADVPARSWFDGLRVEVWGDEGDGDPRGAAPPHGGPGVFFHAFYDAAGGALVDASRLPPLGGDASPRAVPEAAPGAAAGAAPEPAAGVPADLAGRALWTLGRQPRLLPGPQSGELDLLLVIEPGEERIWTGSGYLRATGGLSPYAAMVGLGSEAHEHLAGVIGALAGSELAGHNVAVLEPDAVVAGCALTWKEGDADERERITVTLGDPGGGIAGRLPGDVRLFAEARAAPALLAFPMRQRVEIRMRVGDREVIYMPESARVETAIGSYTLSAEREGEWLTIARELEIDVAVVPPAAWPELRRLLLAEQSPRVRTVLLDAE